MVCAGANAFLAVLNRGTGHGPGLAYTLGASLLAVTFSAVGALVAERLRANPMGPLLCGLGVAVAATSLFQGYALYTTRTRPGALPWGDTAGWVGLWMWVLAVVPAGTFLPLLFPDGRLSSPRRRLVGRLAVFDVVVATVCVAAVARGASPVELEPAVDTTADLVLLGVAGGLFAVVAAASVAAGVVRGRRAVGDERQQLKWFGFAVAIAAAAVLAQFLPPTGQPRPWRACLLFLTAGVPVAIGIAIFRYRLYDIDAVIRRTFVYTVLAAFVTAVYLAVVVGAGALVGARTGDGLWLPLAAMAVTAVGFSGVRTRARRLADRLVHGRRATPYEALARLSEQLAGRVALADFLPTLARALAEATGAARADVWMRVGDRLRLAASHPPSDAAREPPFHGVGVGIGAGAGVGDRSTAEALARAFGAHAAAEVHGPAGPLGVIALTKPPGVPATDMDAKLVADLATHATIAFRDAAREAELRESRRRIVAAQDAERRRLERDVHDGAQQQIVALAVKSRLAGLLVDGDPERARTLLDELAADAESALETLRDLARGIFPAVLADKGLVPALRAHVAKTPSPTQARIEATGPTRRHPPEVEAAVYYCCLEALQNAAKHAPGVPPRVRIDATADGVGFAVADAGPGFDPRVRAETGTGLRNMRDRFEAVGGVLTITSTPGHGTLVAGHVPSPGRRHDPHA